MQTTQLFYHSNTFGYHKVKSGKEATNQSSIDDPNKRFKMERLQLLKQLVDSYQKEINSIETLLKKKAKIPIENIFDTITRNPKDFWNHFNGSRFFMHDEVEPADPWLAHIIQKLRVLKSYVGRVGRKFRYTLHELDVLLNLRYGYYTVNPLKGVAYIIDLHARKGKKWYNRPYMLQHTFSNLYSMEEQAVDNDNKNISNIRINFIVPIAGRHYTMLRFLNKWENDILKPGENVSLTFVVTEGLNHKGQYKTVSKIIQDLRAKYPKQPFHVIRSTKNFQRSSALQKGAEKFGPESLLFFIDIDCTVSRGTLYEIRVNTIKGKQVYFPIVFSQYNPNYTNVNASMPLGIKHQYSYAKGYWRFKGYGMISIYKSDFTKVGGLNMEIRGWGKEDTDFAERVLKKKLLIFRAPSLGLEHIFHSKKCHDKLSKPQYASCQKVKWSSDVSKQIITEMVYRKYYRNHTG